MNHLVKLEIIGDCSDLIMIALCEFGFTSRIESELDSLFIRYSTAFMGGGYHISGRINAYLNDDASLLVKGIRGFRQCTFDTTSGETPRVATGWTVTDRITFLSGTLRAASSLRIISGIAKSTNIIIKERKDYILKPKTSGYTSYHLKVLVPIYLQDYVEYIPAEIQVRTVAMDFWASLDHKIRYKFHESIPLEVQKKMEEYATDIQELDRKMYEMNQIMNKYENRKIETIDTE